MTAADRERWDAKYAGREVPAAIDPPDWLLQHAADLLPGRALDLACGLGHTAIWLAQRGWDVTAMDISPVGLRSAEQLATQVGVHVDWRTADLDDANLGESHFDLITVFRFLDRKTFPARITKALRPGGRLLYETLVKSAHPSSGHARNPAFVLQPGELPSLFPELRVIAYEEFAGGTEPLARLAASHGIVDDLADDDDGF